MRNFRYILLVCLFLFAGACRLFGQHSVNPTNGEYTWLNSAYGEAGKTTTFTLTGDCKITNEMLITAGTVIFDLAGYTFTSKDGDYNLFEVQSGAKLIIRDSKGGGRIQSGVTYSVAAGIHVYGGTFNLESGTISGFKQNMPVYSSSYELVEAAGCAVYIDKGGEFNMSGGEIVDCGFNLENHYGTNADGGTYLYGKVKHMGGAVYISPNTGSEGNYGTFNFTGGLIKNCTSYRGGAVYISAPNANAPLYSNIPYTNPPSNFTDINSIYGFHMSGTAQIENCVASYRGGAVYVDATNGGRAYFKMTGGTIKNCKARSSGCGVHVKGRFEMTGGTIMKNEPDIDANPSNTDYSLDYANKMLMEANAPLGGGICAEGRYEDGKNSEGNQDAIPFYYPAIVNISGGTISGNVAASGGGVMAYDNSKLSLSNATVSENHAVGYKGTGNGGAIYVNNAEFTFNSGTLSGNKARRYGGAININSSAQMSLNGNCLIENNQAGHGGGISQEAGECKIVLSNAGVRIQNNRAIGNYDEKKEVGEYIYPYEYNYLEGNGGGLFVEKGTLNISAGQIKENTANGSGGGIALRSERLSGEITLNISGNVEIQGNVANNDKKNEGEADYKGNNGGNGGGIDIFGTPSNSVKTVITANIKGGSLTDNSADNGGALSVFIDKTYNQENNAEVYIGDETNIALIQSNIATENGGGVMLENGKVTITKGDVNGNSARNGGGIAVKNGSVTIAEGDSRIEKNIAAEKGGGLYVFNSSASSTSIAFTGGNILENKSANGLGGGICADGLINLKTTNTNVKNNAAKNGGGIYLSGGANMTFNGGLICNNVAEGTPASGTTAFQDDADNAGVGGGVYLASGTSLKFFDDDVVKSEFGLYGNTASTAADDIFARGISTSLQLPKVSGMVLDGFDAPTSELYWVEDYVEKDANYTQGTKVNTYTDGSENILRYRYALRNFKDINKIVFEGNEESKTYTSYVCLALGYEQYFVNLVKKGLKRDDSAIFEVSYLKGDNYVPYRTVLFHRDKEDSSGDVNAFVVLTAGKWKFEEKSSWSGSKYSLAGVTSNLPSDLTAEQQTKYAVNPLTGGFEVQIDTDIYTIMKAKGLNTFKYTISNKPIDSNLPSAESAVINKMPAVVTQ